MKWLYTPLRQDHIDFDLLMRLRMKMEKRHASICSERAQFYTTSFKEHENEPYILKKAYAFAKTLTEMHIYIEPDSLIFGNMASCNFAAPIYPEYSIQWVIDELDTFALRKGDVFAISEKVKQDLKDIAPYWQNHTHQDDVNKHLSEEIKIAEAQGVLHRGGISMSGDGHIVCDFEMILAKGFDYFIKEANDHLKHDTLTVQQQAFYHAVIICLNACFTYCERYSEEYSRYAQNCQDEKHRRIYKRLAVMAKDMLHQKARSFYEACEICYLIHIWQMIESNGHSFCYGRFDQYMYPYYQNDIKQHKITKEDAFSYITHMFIMNSSCNKVRPYGHTKFSQGYPLYSNLVVGGKTPDGREGCNELSYLCIEAMHACGLSEPNFSARYHQKTPRSFMRACVKLIATGHGMPSLFNDDVVAKGLMDLQIPSQDAYDYCPIGCVETGVPGKYGHRATGMTYVNWGKVFELLLYNGFDEKTQTQLISINGHKGKHICFHNFDEVLKGWEKILKYYSDISVECDAICDHFLEKYDADPFSSCFVHDAMELGKTLKEGGCRYDIVSQSNIGPTVVGNSLYSMKKLIFDEHKITYEQLLKALEDNWQSEESQYIHKQIKQLAKFGNDEDEVDQMVAYVYESYLKLLPSYHTIRFGRGPKVSAYTMSTSNITSYVPNGFVVSATPDGRYAKAPLNEGCSPTQGTDIHGPTAVINSVSKLPNDKVAAGQLLNMRFAPEALDNEEKSEKFIDFLYTSAKKGIYHNQFNIVDDEILRRAQKNPSKYTDVIVRVAGYCAQFVSLMPEAQEAIIQRTKHY